MVIAVSIFSVVDMARAKARKLLVDVGDGVDPMANRAADQAAPTANELLD